MADQDMRNLIINRMTEDSKGWHAPEDKSANATVSGDGKPLGTSISLSYDFITSDPHHEDYTGFMELGQNAKVAVKRAFDLWQTYANVTFTPVADSNPDKGNGNANINIMYFSEKDTKEYGYSFTTPDTRPKERIVMLNCYHTTTKNNEQNLALNPDSFENINNLRYYRNIIHELSHTLGLVDRYNKPDFNNAYYTIMTKGPEDSVPVYGVNYNTTDPTRVNNPSDVRMANETPMAWDILAVQKLYGVNDTTNLSDTTYGTLGDYVWSGTTPHYLTIWDAGGEKDTIDLSWRTDGTAEIDLRENENNGGYAKITNTNGKVSLYAGIAFSNQGVECVIENATGTNNNDVIHGNDKANILKGNGGADQLYGYAGADELYGGDGDDCLQGGDNQDKLYGENDNDQLYGGKGDDILYGGKGKDILEGNDGIDELRGEENDDELYGGEGNDKLHGGDGVDLLEGEAGNDELNGDDKDDELYGGDGQDKLYGGSGDDILDGGKDNDRLEGGTGVDTYLYTTGEGDDVIYDRRQFRGQYT